MKKVMLVLFMLTGCSGKFVWVSSGAKEKKEIVSAPALNTDLAGVEFTFDDGPDLAKTPKVLDVLKKYNLQATFFVEGVNLSGQSEQAQERRTLLKRVADEGHIIGNHTFDHKDLCRLTPEKAAWEIDSTSSSIQQITNSRVSLVRPPYGKKCKSLTKLLSARNLTAVYWQIDPREWERDAKTHQIKNAAQVVDSIMEQYHNLHDEQGIKKMVIILHDTKQVTVEALPVLLEKLSKEPTKK